MSTDSYYPLVNASFMVNIGNWTFSFARIRNIQQTIDVETVQEGGNNWSVHNLAKPLSSSQKLILERGFLVNGYGDHGLMAGSRVYDVTIMVLWNGSIKKKYFIDQGIVSRWEISDLDALQSQIIYNTIEILHSGLYEGRVS